MKKLLVNGIKHISLSAILSIIWLLSMATVHAAQVTLAWDPSTSMVAGYRVYYGTKSCSDPTFTGYTTIEPNAPALITGTQFATSDLAAGTYYFSVKAFDSAGNESPFSNEVSTAITAVLSTPVAGFSYALNPATGIAPVVASFTDTSTGAITSWSWNFGDSSSASNTSTLKNPTHTYANAGTYTVRLTVTGSAGSNTISRTITVNSSIPLPVASISCSLNPTTGAAPVVATFTDTSTGIITSRSWKFSDTSTSYTTQTVARTYNTPGTYTAELTVSNASGSSKATCNITVIPALPSAEFTANTTSGEAPFTVQFTDGSTPAGGITGWSWNFGDTTSGTNNVSTLQNPSHTYAVAGTYNVTLTVTNSSGSSTKVKTGYITVTTSSTSSDSGLVAAYSFEEISGSVVADISGNDNHGVTSGASRISSGRFGRAMSFDGVDDWVTVNNSNSFALTNGMTLEAWVYPTASMENWRSIITKEYPDKKECAYQLSANSYENTVSTGVYVTELKMIDDDKTKVNASQWTHLTGTYDGAFIRLYVNGTQIAQKLQKGNIVVTDGVLRIGGNSLWGEFFKGYIDEIRIYNRALSASEIQADMTVSLATSSPPSRLIGETALGSVSESLPGGTAMAFATTASATGIITQLPVYVDSGSTATSLMAGIYGDTNGAPGSLLAVGTFSAPKAASWNTVLLPATSVYENTTYWIAILGTNGTFKFRDRVGSTLKPSAKSYATALTTLPATWRSGSTSTAGPVSAYGAGY